MIYDLIDFLSDLFYEVFKFLKSKRKIVIIIFTLLFISFSCNILYFLNDKTVKELKENKNNLFIYYQKFPYRKIYVMNYKLSFSNKLRSNRFAFKLYLIGWKWKTESGRKIYYVLISPYDKNIGYFPENWELYVENVGDKLVLENEEKEYMFSIFSQIKLINEEKDEKIKKMLEYLKEN